MVSRNTLSMKQLQLPYARTMCVIALALDTRMNPALLKLYHSLSLVG